MAPKAKKEGALFLVNYFVKISIIRKNPILIFNGMVIGAVMFLNVTVLCYLHSRNAAYNLLKCRTVKRLLPAAHVSLASL